MTRTVTLVLVTLLCSSGCSKKSPTEPSQTGRAISVTGDLNFGEVQVGTPRQRTFRIANTGTDTVAITSLSGLTNSVFAASWLNGSIASGATQDVILQFTPTESRSYNGTLVINGDQTKGTNTITVTASGTLVGAKFTVSGVISESAPTASTRIPNATVEITEGPNTGRTGTTDGAGNYTIENLDPGAVTITATAPGFQSSSSGLEINGNKTLNLNLRPVAMAVQETLTGSVSGGDSTCSDGTFMKPCKTHSLPIHNSGTVELDLEWTCGCNDVDMTFWINGTLAASSKGVTSRERITINVSGGGTYQVRVTYYEGSTIAHYTLRVTRPN